MNSRRFIDDQFDLFILSLTEFQLRDARETMERPFFSLAKRKRLQPIQYRSGDVWVTVEPHQNYGMATIWDADILIWAASVLIDMKNRGVNDIPNELHFHAHDLLKSIKRDTGGEQYKRLRESLSRLRSTNIQTSIRAPKGKRFAEFSWIAEWTDLVDEKSKESRGMSIVLSQWFVQGVLQKGGVLAIDPEYFSITGGRERWIYRVARKHAGGAGVEGFVISLPTLYEKSGSEGQYRRFKFEMQKLVRKNNLPSISLNWEYVAGKEPRIHMFMRKALEVNENEIVSLKQSNVRKPRPQIRSANEPMDLFLRELDAQTIERIRKDFPRWDIYAIKAEFDYWISCKPERTPSDYSNAFYGFMKTYHEREKHKL